MIHDSNDVCLLSWPRLTRNQSDVACPNPCHTPRGPCRTLFFLRFALCGQTYAKWDQNRRPEARNSTPEAPESTPEAPKSTPEGSQSDPGDSKIDTGGSWRDLGFSWEAPRGSRGVLGGFFVRKCSILEVQNRPKSEVFRCFLKFSDFR